MLDKACAIYMAAGVKWDDFWNGDYTRLKYEMDAYRLRLEARNQEMWLQGFYVYEAVSTAIYNAFRGKGTSPTDYRKEPVRLMPLSEAEKEAEADRTLEKFKAQLTALTGKLERRENARKKEKEPDHIEVMANGS